MKRITWPSGDQKLVKVHRLAFMAETKLYTLPSSDSFGQQMDVSHLCHNKLCIFPPHLTLETHNINMSRSYCRKAGVCTMAHDPPCMLF
ncbi:MAG: hypothetical protein KZQ70_14050 [gamma proteobacterium symbiont of Lucinoma myriamae]|nr:hypothetical protein [gamma proteobacterium symbiont of Lucinoma myriamae]